MSMLLRRMENGFRIPAAEAFWEMKHGDVWKNGERLLTTPVSQPEFDWEGDVSLRITL